MTVEYAKASQAMPISPGLVSLYRWRLNEMFTSDAQRQDECAEMILASVCHAFLVETDEIMSRTRTARIAEARMAFYQLASENGFSISEIAKTMSRPGHNTIQAGMKRCRQLVETDPNYRAKFILAERCFGIISVKNT